MGQVAVYRARYSPTALPAGPAVTWALGPVPDDAAVRGAYSVAGTALAGAEKAALRRRSPADLAAERLELRRSLAVYPGDEHRRLAAVAVEQARFTRDQAAASRAEAARALHSAEHPTLRRPKASRVEAARRTWPAPRPT